MQKCINQTQGQCNVIDTDNARYTKYNLISCKICKTTFKE